MKHVVMFSSGAGSWAAARRVADKYGTDDLFLVFSDVKGSNPSPHAGEDEDNYRFLREASADIGGTLVHLIEGRDIWQVFHDKRFIGNSRLANCSHLLKQAPARKWLEENCDPEDTTIYVGIDWSEIHRMEGVIRNYAPYHAEAPLCEPPYLDRRQVLQILRDRGIEPPRLYKLGFAHANCGGFCVRAGHAHFRHLLEVFPERYAYHEEKEQEIREYLGKNVSVLTVTEKGVKRPITLREFREKIQEQPSLFDLDDFGGCGCFVE
jgi:hypothetical protein